MKYKIIKIREYPLKKSMKNWKVSYRKLAKEAEVDASYVFRLNKGMYIATEKTAKKIIEAFERITRIGGFKFLTGKE